jgi:hypothetical protein
MGWHAFLSGLLSALFPESELALAYFCHLSLVHSFLTRQNFQAGPAEE